MPEDRRGRPMDTFSGGQFYPLDPDHSEVDLRDVAQGLANTCRYGGQCQFYYPVATHSRYVSRELALEHEPIVQLYGLLHDAAEAYVTDVPRPVKGELPAFERIEREIRQSVWKSLGVPQPTEKQWAAVERADDRLLRYEADELLDRFQPDTVPDLQYDLQPCTPPEARGAFLDRAEELIGALSVASVDPTDIRTRGDDPTG